MMNWLLNMRLKYVVLLGLLLFFASLFGIWLYILPDDSFEENEILQDKSFLKSEEGETIGNSFTKDGAFIDDANVVQEYETSDSEEDIKKFNLENNYTELDDGSFHDFNVDRVIAPVKNTLEAAEKQKLPFVLWWSDFTGEKGKIKRCFEGDCFFSNNRSLYSHHLTKAFLFYGTDLDVEDLPLPRKGHHEWGLFHEESPKNNALFYFEDVLKLFNHTATFRQESSYPIASQHIHNEGYLLAPLKHTVQEKNDFKKSKNLSSVVYIQSGCNPPSDRDAYVQELMKYIPIDSYGKCLHNKDLEDKFKSSLTLHNQDFLDFIRQYKFMISFENGICNDYMTEKLFRTISVGVVPIYKGAPNIREWLPSNKSAILIDDFKSPKELAEYIKFVDENPNEYDSYLEYKKAGILNKKLKHELDTREWAINSVYRMSFTTGFECHVCDRIHKNKKSNNTLRYQAKYEDYGCPKPVIYDYPAPKGTENWEREAWEWSYEQGIEKAKEFVNKVTNSK